MKPILFPKRVKQAEPADYSAGTQGKAMGAILGGILGAVAGGVGAAPGAAAGGALGGALSGSSLGGLVGGLTGSQSDKEGSPGSVTQQEGVSDPTPKDSPIARRFAAQQANRLNQLKAAEAAIAQMPNEVKSEYAAPIIQARMLEEQRLGLHDWGIA